MTMTLDTIQSLLVAARAEADAAEAESKAQREAAQRSADIATWQAREAAGPVPPGLRVRVLRYLAGETGGAIPVASPEQVRAYLDGEGWALYDESPRTDPRAVEEYECRELARFVARADEAARDEAARAAKAARDAQHVLDLARVVDLLGDEDARAGWAEGILSHTEPVALLRRALRAPGGVGDRAGALRRNGQRSIKVVDVERVSVDAYRALRALRAQIEALALACPVLLGVVVTTEYELERVTYGHEDDYDETTTGYSVLVRHRVGTIVVESRYALT